MRKRRPEVKQAVATTATIVETGEGRVIVTRLASPINEKKICVEFHALRTLPGNVKHQARVDFHLVSDAEANAIMDALRVALGGSL
jgi:hypothetical protein